MNILMCHNFYAQDGGENGVFRQEARILEENGHVVRLFTRHSAEIHAGGLWTRVRTVMESFHSLRTARELAAIVAEFRPAVAIVQNVFPLLSPSVYSVLGGLGVPVVQFVFNYRLLCSNAQLFVDGSLCERCVRGSPLQAAVHSCLHGSRVLSLWYGLLFAVHRRLDTFRRHIRRFVVPHGFVGRKLVEGGFPADRIRELSNPYQLPALAGIEDPDLYVLFVGRLIPEKGVLSLVQALEHVPPGLRAVIVGDGPTRPQIEAYLATRPALAMRVTLTGPLWGNQVDPLMRGACAFVLPAAWHDVSPLLLYNALALGKPAVGTHLGSQPEIVRDGQDGFIVPAGDPVALGRRLAELAADPELRRRMGQSGRRRAETEFASEVHYGRLHQILDEVVGESL